MWFIYMRLIALTFSFLSSMQVASLSRQNNNILFYDIGYVSTEPVEVSTSCSIIYILDIFMSDC